LEFKGKGPVIVLVNEVILAAGAGVALAAAVLDVAVTVFGGGARAGARAGGSTGYNNTIPRTNPVEDVPARHVEVDKLIVGQIFLLDQGV
jgi:hypothetical protein